MVKFFINHAPHNMETSIIFLYTFRKIIYAPLSHVSDPSQIPKQQLSIIESVTRVPRRSDPQTILERVLGKGEETSDFKIGSSMQAVNGREF